MDADSLMDDVADQSLRDALEKLNHEKWRRMTDDERAYWLVGFSTVAEAVRPLLKYSDGSTEHRFAADYLGALMEATMRNPDGFALAVGRISARVNRALTGLGLTVEDAP